MTLIVNHANSSIRRS